MLLEEKSDIKDKDKDTLDPANPSTQNDTSDPTNSSPDWDKSSLAKLVGLNDDDDTPNFSDEPSLSETSVHPATGDSYGDEGADLTQGNVLDDGDLFDDPHSSGTPKTVAKSPFAKFGLVAGGLGAVFLLAFLLLNGIMSPKGDLKAKVSTPTPTPTVDAQKEEENTEGQLKTELALNSQSDELKQLDEAKKNQKKQEVSPTDPNRQKTADGKATSPTPATAPAARPTSSPSPRTYSSRPPSRPQVSSPPERPAPVQPAPSSPFSQLARSAPSSVTPAPRAIPVSSKATAAPRAVPSPAPTPTAAKIASSPTLDPMTQWQNLVSLGSYSAPPSSDRVATGASNGGVASALRDTRQQERQFSRPGAPAASQPQATPQATSAPSLEQAEQRLLGGTPYRVAASGSMAAGVLVTPALVPVDAKEAPARIVVSLQEPLTDTSGQTVMPAGTNLVFETKSIDGNGVMSAVAVSQLDSTGMERALPSDALVLTGSQGAPLIAKGYFDDGGTIASMDVSTAILGALGKFGEILNRPKEQTSSSVSGSTVSQTTTSTTGDPNILGALLEGGAGPVLEQIMKRNDRAIQDMQQRKNLWFLEAGTSVQVLVNHSFEL